MPRLALSLVAIVALALAGLAAGLSQIPEEGSGTIRSPHGISGAAEALVWWELQRQYPLEAFPSEGLTAAVDQHRAMQARMAEPGSLWEPMGPFNQGGRTLTVEINPLRGESVWIGSAGGGLWRSYNAGLDGSWSASRLACR